MSSSRAITAHGTPATVTDERDVAFSPSAARKFEPLIHNVVPAPPKSGDTLVMLGDIAGSYVYSHRVAGEQDEECTRKTF